MVDQHRPEQSADLLRQAQAGDRAAFDALIRRQQPKLLALVRARLGARLREFEESTDIIQTVLAAAVRDLSRFEYRGEGSFVRWLSTLLENKIRHRVRDLHRAKRAPERARPLDHGTSVPGGVDLPSPGPTASEVAVGRELEDRYTLALRRLDDGERELLLLHLDLGCSYQEIAEALGAPSSEAVRKRIARSLVRLEQLMRATPPGDAP